MNESHSDLYIVNPFRLTPDGFIQCYSTNRKILDPWIMWSYSGGFDTKDIVELYGRWLDGELKSVAPYLPTPPSIERITAMKRCRLNTL
jgi:hypothetical protein